MIPRWAKTAAASIVALALAGGGGWWFLQPEPLSGKPSVAVLPFNNYGGDEASGRLADGLTEDIITDLARFPEFEVVARNSTEVYKGKPVDARQVASALHVGFVLEGSIQRQSGRVRITAQLIDAKPATIFGRRIGTGPPRTCSPFRPKSQNRSPTASAAEWD